MTKNLPTYEQLRHYYCVIQADDNLPCAMFVLEIDAKEWIAQQKTKEIYSIFKVAK